MSDKESAELVSTEDMALLERVITAGDLGNLKPEDRLRWYVARCRSCGLDPFSQPFDYLRLSGRLVLYANKGATEQLAQKHRLALSIVKQERMADLFIVTARATDPSGRSTEDVGAVAIAGLGGVDLANAMMRGVTKAKRRAVLSLCGLGMMDETDAANLPGGGLAGVNPATGEVMEVTPAEPETETAALKRTTGHLFAAAAEAGINTDEIERMRRLCGAVLVREVEQVRTLDPADRATVGYWIQANPADAYLLAHPEGAEEAARGIAIRIAEAAAAGTDYVPSGREAAPGTLLAVQAAERGPYAQQMGI